MGLSFDKVFNVGFGFWVGPAQVWWLDRAFGSTQFQRGAVAQWQRTAALLQASRWSLNMRGFFAKNQQRKD